MFDRLRPLVARLHFEERAYKLGETITVGVELVARADCQVREGKVELVSDARYRDVFPSFKLEGASFTVGDKVVEPVQPVVHCTVVFLTETRMRPGLTRKYGAKLQVPPEQPLQLAEIPGGLPSAAGNSEDQHRIADRNWWLQVAVDVVDAPDVGQRRAIRVVSEHGREEGNGSSVP